MSSEFSKRLTWLNNAKPGTSLEVWKHPLCSKPFHVVAVTKMGELRQDFSSESAARDLFEKMSQEMV